MAFQTLSQSYNKVYAIKPTYICFVMLMGFRKSLAAVFGAWLLLPSIWGYYAQWYYLPAYNAFFYGLLFFIFSVLLWFIFLILCKGNIYRASVATFLYIVVFHIVFYFIYYIFGAQYFLSYQGYMLASLVVVGISLFLSYRNRVVDFIASTAIYLSTIMLIFNYLFIPIYNYIRHNYSFIPVGLENRDMSSKARNIYLIILDEFPSPSVSKEIFTGIDTLIVKLKGWGFIAIDSVNSNSYWRIKPFGTVATLGSIYRTPSDSHIIPTKMKDAKLIDILDSLGYENIGIWPFYPLITHIRFSWRYWILPTSLLDNMPILYCFSYRIKYLYDVLFYRLLKRYVSDYSDGHLRFHHIHSFITHYPYVTGKEGRWLTGRKMSFYERMLEALSKEALKWIGMGEMSFYERMREAYAFQVEMLLELIQSIKLHANQKGVPDPIIFVLSDHGMHAEEPKKINISDQTLADNLKYQAFFMAYVPFWPDSVVRQQLSGCHDFRCISTFIETVAKANLLHESSHPNPEK